MRDVLEQISAANTARLYYVALFSALAVPDICGALESPDGLATGARYAAWFDRQVAPLHAPAGTPIMTGHDLYLFRCSMLHQGRAQHPKSPFSRIIFIEPGATTNVLHYCRIAGALMIDVQLFVAEVVEAAEKWLEVAGHKPEFATNYSAFVARHSEGLAPYVAGVPIIG